MQDQDLNIFEGLHEACASGLLGILILEMLQFIQRAILSTDMALHGSYFNLLSSFSPSSLNEALSPEERSLLGCFILKFADISNVSRPYRIYSKWVDALLEEYSIQVNIESAMGLTGTSMQLSHVFSKAELQRSFMDFVAVPYFTLLARVFDRGCLDAILENLGFNRKMWEEEV